MIIKYIIIYNYFIMKLLKGIKNLDFIIVCILAIYISFDINMPSDIASLIDNVIGNLLVMVAVLYVYLNSNAVVPKSAPPEASDTKAVSAVIVADLILDVPLSIAPNPEVIDPESNAPVVTMLPPPTL